MYGWIVMHEYSRERIEEERRICYVVKKGMVFLSQIYMYM